jgi:DNA polymerase-3 subunit delta
MKHYQALLKEIENGQFAPVYFFYGEEEYLIEKLVDALARRVVPPESRDFNQETVYGSEIDANRLVSMARAYPMMAQHRLVIAKQLHRMRKDQFEQLVGYLTDPVPSTVLVLVYNSRRPPDKRTKFGKTVMNQARVFEAKPLYENQVPGWIQQHLKEQGVTIDQQASALIAAALGTNLGLIESELNKILLYMKTQNLAHIDQELVFQLINIDKDFNVFELLDRIGQRNRGEAELIIAQMMKNPKDNPPILLLSQLFNYFCRLALCHEARAHSEQAIAKVLGLNPFIARQYVAAVRNYPWPSIQAALQTIYEADLALKGITATKMSDAHIMKTTVLKVLRR